MLPYEEENMQLVRKHFGRNLIAAQELLDFGVAAGERFDRRPPPSHYSAATAYYLRCMLARELARFSSIIDLSSKARNDDVLSLTRGAI